MKQTQAIQTIDGAKNETPTEYQIYCQQIRNAINRDIQEKKEQTYFVKILDLMTRSGMKTPRPRKHYKIPNAKNILYNFFEYFLSFQNNTFSWQKEYDEVVKWLENSEGLGLFMYGSCGRGKSMLARFVIPAIFLKFHNVPIICYDVQEMNREIDTVLLTRSISLDEIGVENSAMEWGNKRDAFFEVMDNVEKYNKLIIVSTNLTASEITKKYGERVTERIIATTKQVEFKGKSLRK